MPDVKLVFVTVPAESGEPSFASRNIAETLVTEKLAACVNRLPGAKSTYLWENELHVDAEDLLLIKTSSQRLRKLILRVQELHPYQVPEVLVVDVQDGLPAYLDWVLSQCKPGD